MPANKISELIIHLPLCMQCVACIVLSLWYLSILSWVKTLLVVKLEICKTASFSKLVSLYCDFYQHRFFYWISSLISLWWENIPFHGRTPAPTAKEAWSVSRNHAMTREYNHKHASEGVSCPLLIVFITLHMTQKSKALTASRGLMSPGARSWLFRSPSDLRQVVKFLWASVVSPVKPGWHYSSHHQEGCREHGSTIHISGTC